MASRLLTEDSRCERVVVPIVVLGAEAVTAWSLIGEVSVWSVCEDACPDARYGGMVELPVSVVDCGSSVFHVLFEVDVALVEPCDLVGVRMGAHSGASGPRLNIVESLWSGAGAFVLRVDSVVLGSVG